MPRVLVTPTVVNGLPGPYADVLRAAGFEIVYPPKGLPLSDPEVLLAHLEGIDATIASMEPYTPDVLARCRLRVIARFGVGFDAIDLPAATQHGIVVCNTPGTLEQSVAETTIALILGVFRGWPGRLEEVRRGQWVRKALPRLAGRTLGLVGLGRIGKAVVPRAQGLGLTVIAHDPVADREFAAQHNVELCSLEELLSRADIVSLHLPGSTQCANLINRQTLARINTARGSLVDEAALVESLESGHLLGAGLDVFQVEPLPTDSPLLKFPNVLVSPHTGGLDCESQEAVGRRAAQSIVDLYQGRWPEGYVVNPDVRAGWRW
jgi:D-3-phosphoglycerate dehydrogenase